MRMTTLPPCRVRLALETAAVAIVDGAPQPLMALDAGLLAWLAVEGPTARSKLVALLWPQSGAEAGRNALRQRLFRLRRTLGLDAVQGQATLALAGAVAHDLGEAQGLLEAVPADELPGGDFAQWLARERERRRGLQRTHTARQADAAEHAGDWDAALQHAAALLALEPLSEDAHRRLMRLHYLRGDRAAALLAFDRYERLLKDEVGARPAAPTLALLATIEAAAPPQAAAAPSAPPPGVLRPPRLIGRDRELAALRQALQAGQVAALHGEAGLGKTRLLQAVAALQQGTVMAAGRPGDAGVPFATLARLLRELVRQASQAPTRLLAAGTRAEVARVLPEFDGAVAARAGGEGQRLALLRAVRALLDACPGVHQLVVDDLHFADDASIEMLGHLIDADADAADADAARAPSHDPRRRWLLACRPAEAGTPLQALHDRLVEQVLLAPLRLAPLDEAALAELVDSLALPGVSGARLAPGLLRRTGGNPLFVLETLKQAWVEGSLARLADAAVLPRPLTVGRLIERRLTQLSPGALALARVAAVAGVDFGVGLAEHVLGASAMQFADALNELETAQVLRDTQFAHDLVHDAVRASVPAAIARHTHLGVAAWLEAHGGEPARVARHWIDGGQPVRALPWLQRAAQAAAAALRPREQLAFLDEKGAIEQAAGDRAAAFESGLEAMRLATSIDNEPSDIAARGDRVEALADDDAARVHCTLARSNAHKTRGEFAAVVELAQRALPLARHDARLQALVHSELGSGLAMLDRHAEALPHMQGALAWLDVHGSAMDRGVAHGELAIALDNSGRLDEALAHHQGAYELLRHLDDIPLLGSVCGNLACNRIDAGDLDAADEALVRGQQWLATSEEQQAQAPILQLLRALVLGGLQRYGDALTQVQLALDTTRRYQPAYLPRAQLREAQLWALLGQWGRVHQALQAVAPVLADAGWPPRLMHAVLQHQAARVGLGQADAGWQAMAQLRDEIGPHIRPDLRLPLRIEMAAQLPPEAAWDELQAVAQEAMRLGHRGSALAAWVRAAGLVDIGEVPARTAAEAALALWQRGVRSVHLAPAEAWLHIGRGLQAAGDARHAALWREGAAKLRRVADEQVPEPFRDSFLRRQPVHEALLRCAG